jgi:hypothetical protein
LVEWGATSSYLLIFYSPIPQPLTPRRGKGSLMRTAHLASARRIYKYARDAGRHDTKKRDAEKRGLNEGVAEVTKPNRLFALRLPLPRRG